MSLLKGLMVETKTAWIDYPGLRDFQVEVAHLSRAESIKLRKKSTISKFDRKTREPKEELDEDKFIREFTKLTIKNWKGLKIKDLETLIPVDLSGQDPEADVPFNLEDAEMLIVNSTDFDKWINEQVYDLENFRSEPEGTPMGEAN